MESSKITALTPSPRDPDRIRVKVDGKHAATLSVQTVSDLGLHVGQPCDPAGIEALTEAAAVDKAIKQAMNRLGRRALSRRELDRRLTRLQHPPAVRGRVLDRLTELGLIDDEAYARALVREISSARPAGPRLLRQKLFQRGIDDAVIQTALAESAPDAQTQAEQATDLALKRARSLQRHPAEVIQRRVYAMLARRGFDRDAIDTAMQALGQAIRDE